MTQPDYRDGILCLEDLPLTAIAESYGTPVYVYSRHAIEQQWQAFDRAFGKHPHLVCYAVKANSNLAILNLLARLGSGFDIVSVGELERVLRAGGEPGKVVFSGVGKRRDEIERALECGIRCFNVESIAELERINDIANATGVKAPVSLRVNPDVDAGTHPYIATGLKENKFGIDFSDALATYLEAARMPGIELAGIDCHIGSQITELAPFRDALQRLLGLLAQLEEHAVHIRHIDIGGGLGIPYEAQEAVPDPADYAAMIIATLGERKLEIIMEPGRAIVGNAGLLLTRVEYLKHNQAHHFAIVDAAMNDLLRPSLYNAWHGILPVREQGDGREESYDIVGPVCETGDFLGKGRRLRLQPGSLLAVCSAGAYAYSMSSNYNSRPRVSEVLIDGAAHHLIRRQESLEDLFSHEQTLP